MIAKEKIYTAALSLISKKGYDQTTLIDICKEAEIGKGTFYHYFKSKMDILITYIKDESTDLFDFYNSLTETSCREKLRKYLDYQLDYYKKKGPEIIRTIYSSEIKSGSDIFRIGEFATIRLIEKNINQGQAEGEYITSQSSKLLTKMLWGLIFYSTTEWSVTEEYYDIKETLLPELYKLIDLISC